MEGVALETSFRQALMTIMLAFVIISPVYILAIWFGPPPLFSCSVIEVSGIDIEYYGSDYGVTGGKHRLLTLSHDEAAIRELCKKISAMKLVLYEKPGEYEYQKSDPAFKITINYRNNTRDVFFGSTGEKWIYRMWGDHRGRVGGINHEVFSFVNNLGSMNNAGTGN